MNRGRDLDAKLFKAILALRTRIPAVPLYARAVWVPPLPSPRRGAVAQGGRRHPAARPARDSTETVCVCMSARARVCVRVCVCARVL